MFIDVRCIFILIIILHLYFSVGKSDNKNQNNFQPEKTPVATENTPLRTQKSLPSLTPTPPLSNNLLSNVQPDQLKQLALMLLLKKQSNGLPTQSSPKLSYKIRVIKPDGVVISYQYEAYNFI